MPWYRIEGRLEKVANLESQGAVGTSDRLLTKDFILPKDIFGDSDSDTFSNINSDVVDINLDIFRNISTKVADFRPTDLELPPPVNNQTENLPPVVELLRRHSAPCTRITSTRGRSVSQP